MLAPLIAGAVYLARGELSVLSGGLSVVAAFVVALGLINAGRRSSERKVAVARTTAQLERGMVRIRIQGHIQAALWSDDAAVLEAALRALKPFEVRAADDRLEALLQHESVRVRFEAAWVLIERHGRERLDALIDHVAAPNAADRWRAVEQLARRQDQKPPLMPDAVRNAIVSGEDARLVLPAVERPDPNAEAVESMGEPGWSQRWLEQQPIDGLRAYEVALEAIPDPPAESDTVVPMPLAIDVERVVRLAESPDPQASACALRVLTLASPYIE